MRAVSTAGAPENVYPNGLHLGTMVPTRRGVLTATAATVAALAGCNEGTDPSGEGTVTPADVPLTDAELLAKAASIEGPTLPSAVVVTEDHLAAAIGQAESTLTAVEARLDELEELHEEDASHHTGPFPGDADEMITRAEDQLARARDAEPSVEALDHARRAVWRIAPLYGYVRAKVGEVGPERLRADVAAERERLSTVRERYRYRVREPLEEYLPTLYAAEGALVGGRGVERAAELAAEADADADRYPTLAADVQIRIERNRRRCDDAARFLETATDPGAPSIADAIEAEYAAARSELGRISREYPESGSRPDDSTLRGTIRSFRHRTADRCREIRFRSGQEFEDGWLVHPLVGAIRARIAFDATDEAVAKTLDRLEAGEFPAEEVLAEKERAVANLETAAEGDALQRHLAVDVPRLEMADRRAGEELEDGDLETITHVHVTYAAVAASAELAVERGTRLSSSLQG